MSPIIPCLCTVQGRIRKAAWNLRRRFGFNPKNAKAHANLGITLADLGELDEAEASLREALRLNPMQGAATEALEN